MCSIIVGSCGRSVKVQVPAHHTTVYGRIMGFGMKALMKNNRQTSFVAIVRGTSNRQKVPGTLI